MANLDILKILEGAVGGFRASKELEVANALKRELQSRALEAAAERTRVAQEGQDRRQAEADRLKRAAAGEKELGGILKSFPQLGGLAEGLSAPSDEIRSVASELGRVQESVASLRKIGTPESERRANELENLAEEMFGDSEEITLGDIVRSEIESKIQGEERKESEKALEDELDLVDKGLSLEEIQARLGRPPSDQVVAAFQLRDRRKRQEEVEERISSAVDKAKEIRLTKGGSPAALLSGLLSPGQVTQGMIDEVAGVPEPEGVTFFNDSDIRLSRAVVSNEFSIYGGAPPLTDKEQAWEEANPGFLTDAVREDRRIRIFLRGKDPDKWAAHRESKRPPLADPDVTARFAQEFSELPLEEVDDKLQFIRRYPDELMEFGIELDVLEDVLVKRLVTEAPER